MSTVLRRFVVYGFDSVHNALAAESALASSGVSATAIPSPRELGELCGVALRVEPDRGAAAEAVFAACGIAPRATAEIDDL